MTEPTTAADRLLTLLKRLDTWEEIERGVLLIDEIRVEARQQDGSALRLLRMAAPRLAIGGAATDAWLFEVRAFLKVAALPPSAPPGPLVTPSDIGDYEIREGVRGPLLEPER